MPRTPQHEDEDDIVNAFRSKRLVYRAPDDDSEDRACLHRYANDPVINLMGSSRLLKPQGEHQTRDALKPSPGMLLSVLICLTPEEEDRELRKAAGADDEEDMDDASLAKTSPAAQEKNKKPTPIGVLQLYDHAREKAHNRCAKLGIAVFGGFRGRGYGGEAINWALDWAFRRAHMHRISLQAHEWNLSALALYRKLGFVEEGRERESGFYNRRYWDTFTLGMLVHEWEKLRGLEPVAK